MTGHAAARGRVDRVHVAVVALLALVVGALLVVSALPASAHAVLLEAEPADGAGETEAPATVRLVFNEPVEVPTGGLRVFDAAAERVDEGAVATDDAAVVEVALPADLPDGGYVASYRVVSADGHPVAGVTTFTVGAGDGVDDATLAELFGGAGGDVAGFLGPLLRGLGSAAALLAVGAVLFAMVVARRGPDRQLARRIGAGAAAAGAGLGLLAVPVQVVAVTGVGWSAALGGAGLAEVLDSSFGHGTLLRSSALAVLALAWRRATGAGAALVAPLAGLAALASFPLDGHQRTQEPSWLLVGGDLVHVTAGAAWFGGVVLLTVALARERRSPDPVGAGGLVARFSTVALVSVVLLAAAGVAMAVPLVGTPAALGATTYGGLLLAKVVATVLVVVLAVYNRWRLLPALRSAGREVAWERLRTTVRLEAVLLAAVLLVTGALVSTPPAVQEAGLTGHYQTTAALGDDLELDLVVEPNRVGRNTLHLYALDATGRPTREVEQLRLELTYVPEGIGPITIEPFVAGPGHWIASGEQLAFAGEWQLRVVAALDRFEEREAVLTVPVAQ